MTKLAVVGMSHIEAIRRAWTKDAPLWPGREVDFLNLRTLRPGAEDAPSDFPALVRDHYRPLVDAADAVVLCVGGNEHNVVGLLALTSEEAARESLRVSVASLLRHWLPVLANNKRTAFLMPPPPNGCEQHIRDNPGVFAEDLARSAIRPAAARLALWQLQCEYIRSAAAEHGLEVVELPSTVFSEAGMLSPDCHGRDPTHGNLVLGRRVLAALFEHFEAQRSLPAPPHPYVGLADTAYWKSAVAKVAPDAIDPLDSPRFQISANDKVATAGSCFAQHISKRLRSAGFHFLVSEQAEAGGDGESRGFYDFSARYGNVYTARQLLQLFDRAHGYFVPQEQVWERPGGGFCDPFRPRIEPDGFTTGQAVLDDAQRHFAAVRSMFRNLDVFVFTLGLTECWLSELDGAAYPIAPGVAGGRFDPTRHRFVNFRPDEVVADMKAFLHKLRLVNPGARVILTVSPVPLAATREPRHVLVSTTYSKAVLRVAAEEIQAGDSLVQYFPSYEIITGPHAGGRYFGPDLRSVTEAGVDHVMRVFMARMTQGRATVAGTTTSESRPDAYARMQALAEAACDEELYARPEPD